MVQWTNPDERNLQSYVQEHRQLQSEEPIKELFQIEVDFKMTLSTMHVPEQDPFAVKAPINDSRKLT